jgi:hypothetical protein
MFESFDFSLMGPRLAERILNEPGIYIINRHRINDTFRTHLDINQLGNFYGQASIHAPNYLIKASGHNNSDDLIIMPLAPFDAPLRLCVLVRNDIYEAYGQSIRNAGEYEALLAWIQANYQNEPASITTALQSHPVFNPDGFDMTSLPLDLFLPEMGYRSLDGMFLRYAWHGNNLWQNNTTGAAKAWHNIESVQEAWLRLLTWTEQQFIEFKNETEINNDIANRLMPYPTILTYSKVYFGRENHTGFVHYMRTGDVDLTQYTINLFPHPAMAYFDDAIRDFDLAVGTKGVNATDFLRFMEWLEDMDNYRFFMYGKEGIDYEGFASFRNILFDDYITGVSHDKYPVGFLEEAQLFPQPVYPLGRDDMLRVYYELERTRRRHDGMESNYFFNLRYVDRELSQLMQILFGEQKHLRRSPPHFYIDEMLDRIRDTENAMFQWVDFAEELVNEVSGMTERNS